jgi:calcineurin-like phosphoesterase family protein
MNKSIIHNHNSRVKEDDVVFHVGDFCFRNSPGGKDGEGEQLTARFYRKQLNGEMVFIKGNHDGNNSLKTIIHHAVIEFAGHEIYLVHNPVDHNPKFKLNFVGHIHNLFKFKYIPQTKTLLVNVGVDIWRYMPITFDEIYRELNKWLKENKIKGI